jgi:Na+-transporting methylmalonyl-CoA/oxaloacetate decarboxylase gamma subunit
MVHFLLQNAQTTEAAEEITEVVSKASNIGLLGQALEITLIGMVILFISLVILWGVMELLVRFVKDGPKEEEADASDNVETADAGDEMKLKAAAAAAAYVIAKK